MESHYVEKLREYLQANGRRLTNEKELVVHTVVGLKKTFDPEDVMTALESHVKQRLVSPSTVHRAMDDMKNAGLIRSVSRFPGQHAFLLLAIGD